jgi:ribonucleoside-diphosphate reductase alpha chain
MLLRLGIPSTIYPNRRPAGESILPDGKGGQAAYRTQVQHELVISGENLSTFAALIGFSDSDKQSHLQRLLGTYSRALNHAKFFATVEAITADGEEDVYDVQVPGINTFDANGLHAHNCGEQPLPPYGSCLLGSVNLTMFVRDPFGPKARFDWDEYKEVVRVFTRMLDNVVEINGLPLEQQRGEITRKRRHGMGFLGLGSTITMLKMRYGSAESCEFTEQIARDMALAGWEVALSLAEEKGPAPIMSEQFDVTAAMLRQRPEMVADGYHVGDKVPGRLLHAKYSRYMQRVAVEAPELVAQLAETGARFTHHSSIAPTGTISLSLANNASNGIEPSFAHHYSRNVIREGKKSKEKVEVFSYELLAYRELINADAMPSSDRRASNEAEQKLPEYFVSADDITPKEHVDIQAAAQRWVDSSISKTANVPTDYPYEDFKDIYRYAHKQGLKGCTTFRFNPAAFQGVLVKEADLENTLYRFELEDGTVVEAKGNDEIEYDGEKHTAANLFDALKEGYYGKF